MAQSVLDSVSGDLIPLGHSMGGRVALELVRLAPERVKALGLIATGAHPLAEGETEKREAVIKLANEQGMPGALVEVATAYGCEGLCRE